MIEALALAGGLVGGVELRLLVLLGAAIWMPIPTAVAVLVAVMLGRRDEIRSRAGGDVRFAETVAGELRAGASLRAALRVACAEKTGGRRIVRRLRRAERRRRPLIARYHASAAASSICAVICVVAVAVSMSHCNCPRSRSERTRPRRTLSHRSITR